MNAEELKSIKVMAINYGDPIRGKILALVTTIETQMIDKQKLINWLTRKEKEDKGLADGLTDLENVKKHEHYAYCSKAVQEEIERGTFDFQ